MTEDTKTDSVVQDVTELTQEQRTEAWFNWVRSEVNAALDIYLPVSKMVDVNVSYRPTTQEEGKTESNDNMKSGVTLTLLFDFETPIDINKPRVE